MLLCLVTIMDSITIRNRGRIRVLSTATIHNGIVREKLVVYMRVPRRSFASLIMVIAVVCKPICICV